MAVSSSRVPVALWAVALGATGFAAGFFGPIALNPEANQGPLLGIFITGPGGMLAGFALGAIARALPISNLRRWQALMLSCAALAIGVLVFCLPEPAVRGYVIDAEVEDCASPTGSVSAAIARWERAVAEVTWATPPANWRETAAHNVASDPGVVLTMRVVRRTAIYEHRKPWNRGTLTASPWQVVETPERYYARDEGRACAPYLARSRDLYMPFNDSASRPDTQTQTWPPTDTTSFLRLLELGPVPAEYRRLLH